MKRVFVRNVTEWFGRNYFQCNCGRHEGGCFETSPIMRVLESSVVYTIDKDHRNIN